MAAADIVDQAARAAVDIVAAIAVAADPQGDHGGTAPEPVVTLFAPAARRGPMAAIPGAAMVAAVAIAMVVMAAPVAIAAMIAVMAAAPVPVIAAIPVVMSVTALFELGLSGVASRCGRRACGPGRVRGGKGAGGQADGQGTGQGTDPTLHLILPFWQASRVRFRV